jgi:hypothetical protein
MRKALAVLLATATFSAVAVSQGAGPVSASIPHNVKWKSSARLGQWNNGGFTIDNNMWNGGAGPQTTWANSYQHWGSESRQKAGNTAIETYPCVIKNYNSPRVSSFRLIQNGYTESMPRDHQGLHAEAADDVWLNNYAIEVMIWVDRVGRPVYAKVIGRVTMYGQRFVIYKLGTEYIFVMQRQVTSGRTHVLAAIQWLQKHHFVKTNATLRSVEFGWEIASTGGRAEDFTLSRYWLHTRRV